MRRFGFLVIIDEGGLADLQGSSVRAFRGRLSIDFEREDEAQKLAATLLAQPAPAPCPPPPGGDCDRDQLRHMAPGVLDVEPANRLADPRTRVAQRSAAAVRLVVRDRLLDDFQQLALHERLQQRGTPRAVSTGSSS